MSMSTDPRAADSVQPPRHPLKIPVIGLFVLALIHSLIFASEFLIPVTTAVLGYFILNAPRRLLERIGIPAPVAAGLFTISIAIALAIGATALTEPVTEFIQDLPGLIDKVMASMTGPSGPLDLFNRAAEVTDKAMAEASGEPPLRVQVVDNGGGLATSVASVAPGLMGQVVFAMCLLFFLVSSGDMFIQKAVQVADRLTDKKATLVTIRRIEARLGNYLGAITLINIGLGFAIGTAMWLLGMPSPWLIGLMATVLNFVPFVGAIVGTLVAGVIGFVAFEDLWPAFGVMGSYYALTALEGQIITPTLLGHRLRLNVTMVFLSVAFFAWIWSVMGMVMAVPLLIVIKVFCDSVPGLRKIGLFLGDANGFYPEEDVNHPAKSHA